MSSECGGTTVNFDDAIVCRASTGENVFFVSYFFKSLEGEHRRFGARRTERNGGTGRPGPTARVIIRTT